MPEKRWFPVSIWKIMQPNDHKSDAVVGGLLCKISGDTNWAVPTNEFFLRTGLAPSAPADDDSFFFCSSGSSRIRAVPKSVNFMWKFSSRRIFSGFRSLQWIIFFCYGKMSNWWRRCLLKLPVYYHFSVHEF